MMCGVWVAFEDVCPDQGSLRLCAKSNRHPEMNYQDFDLEGSERQYPEYLRGVEQLIEQNLLLKNER